MKKLLLLFIIFPLFLQANEYRVLHLYSNLRIVIVDIPCNLPNLHGERASAQRLDRLFIPGCWYRMEEHPEMIHIDWHNGDYSELPYSKFEKVDK